MRAVAIAAWVLLGPCAAWASGAGPVEPFAFDQYGGPAADQAAFYGAGHAGVLMGGAPFARLFAGWRLLHGQPVGTEAGARLAVPCCGTFDVGEPMAGQWIEDRKAVPGAPEVAYVRTFRNVGDFASVQTCFPDAFATASRTLHERIAAHGPDDPGVRAWLAAQDSVFEACSGAPTMPPLPDAAPEWLVHDRDYQVAAQALYERRFADAEARFAAIADDAASPWRPLGSYLATRAALMAAVGTHDPVLEANARKRLAALSPPDAPGHADAAPLGQALDFRYRPDERRTALVAELTGPTLPATAASDFKDLRLLGQKPAGDPEVLDWLTVFGRQPDKPEGEWFEHYGTETLWTTDADALAHARGRWLAGHDPAWMLAAIEATSRGKGGDDLVLAARALPPSHPAFLTAAYHRLRLTFGTDPAAQRAELDAILARPDLLLSSRNVFVAERDMLARDQGDFVRFALRTPPCDNQPGKSEWPVSPTACPGDALSVYYPDKDPAGQFGDDALRTIDRMTLARRAALAEDPQLSPPLRLDVALTTWTRAVLAGDDAVADRLARDLVALLPQMATEWQRFMAAPPGLEKRFAAWFALAKLPGAATDLADDGAAQSRKDGVVVGDYTRPLGTVANFQGHWPDWRYGPPAARPVAAPAPAFDLVCHGMCGAGAFPYRAPDFVAAELPTAERERGRFHPGLKAAGAGSVWEDLLGYARAHPSDPRSPEALYWLVRVSRFGEGHARSSFRAWTLLKQRYRDSTWAKASPYFYD